MEGIGRRMGSETNPGKNERHYLKHKQSQKKKKKAGMWLK
jgi:hypothetical protein